MGCPCPFETVKGLLSKRKRVRCSYILFYTTPIFLSSHHKTAYSLSLTIFFGEELKRAFTRERIMEKKKAVQKPETLNPGTIFAARRIKRAFTMREKIPSVTMVRGSVSIVTTGLIKALMRPSTIARTRAPISVTSTPGNRYATSTIAIAEIIQCFIFIFLFYHTYPGKKSFLIFVLGTPILRSNALKASTIVCGPER